LTHINAGLPAHPQTLTNTSPAVPLPDLTTAQLLGWILAALFLQASEGVDENNMARCSLV
jgi:hypothetical protein